MIPLVKSPKTFASVISYLLASAMASSFNAAFAEAGTSSISDKSAPQILGAPDPRPASDPPDTTELQVRVLMRVNEALRRGSLSVAQASNLKDQLNQWSSNENWYKSANQPIPASLVKENTQLLSKLCAALEKRQAPMQSSTDALHTNIDELIRTALSRNVITSSQAEAYYSRLAQIESNIETINADPSHHPEEITAVNRSLAKLEEDVRTARSPSYN